MEDVTAKLTAALAMFIGCDEYRERVDNLAMLEGSPPELVEPHRSPEMQEALELLDDLKAGRIRCVKTGDTP